MTEPRQDSGQPGLPPLLAGDAPNPGLLRSPLMVLGLVIILGALALGSVLILPDWIAERDKSAEAHAVASSSARLSKTPAASRSTNDAMDEIVGKAPLKGSAKDADRRQQAETDLARALESQARLESARTRTWAGEQTAQILRTLKQGDAAFSTARYAKASTLYQNASKASDVLLASRESRLRQSLQAATEALADETAQDSGPRAMKALHTALAIEPEHSAAQAMLARARPRQQVQALTSTARQALDEDRYKEASQALAEAARLDPRFRLVAALRQKLEARQAATRLRKQLSVALDALDHARLTQARKALQAAAQLISHLPPGDADHQAMVQALDHAQTRLNRAGLATRLNHLRKQAEQAEAKEEWALAIKTYRDAMRLDDSAGFAVAGLKRSQALQALQRQIDHYLQRPERLSSSQPLRNARLVMDNAEALKPEGAKLRAAIARLDTLLAEASHPLTVSLQSDGKTEVSIMYIGTLGTFTKSSYSLVPGLYTFTGSRPGYRDVRITRRIERSTPRPVIQIRCEEPV